MARADFYTTPTTTLDSRYVNVGGDTMTGNLTVPKVILSSNAIYPSADSTTAIQLNKADGITNVLNVDTANGRVGIGTTGPGAKLDIDGGGGSSTGLKISNLGTAIYGIDLSNSNLSGSDYLLYGGASNFWQASGYIYANSIYLYNSGVTSFEVGNWINFRNPSSGIVDLQISPNHKTAIGTGQYTDSGVRFHVRENTTTTNAVVETQRIEAIVSTASTGGSIGFGPGLTFYGESATDGNYRQMGQIDTVWTDATDTTRTSKMTLSTVNSSVLNPAVTILGSGNLGIGTTAPTNLVSLGGNSARTFWMERHTTANTAGNTLTVQAGGATSGATDKSGGDLFLASGIATGSGSSNVCIQAVAAGASGTADRSPATVATFAGTGDLTVTRDLAAVGGFKHTAGTWYRYNLSTGQSAVAMGVAGTLNPTDGTTHQVTEIVMPYAGSIMGITLASNGARTAGSLTTDVTINGIVTGLQAILDASNTQYHYAVQAKDINTFSAGGRLGVKFTTSGDWAPITADIVVTVIVEF